MHVYVSRFQIDSFSRLKSPPSNYDFLVLITGLIRSYIYYHVHAHYFPSLFFYCLPLRLLLRPNAFLTSLTTSTVWSFFPIIYSLPFSSPLFYLFSHFLFSSTCLSSPALLRDGTKGSMADKARLLALIAITEGSGGSATKASIEEYDQVKIILTPFLFYLTIL